MPTRRTALQGALALSAAALTPAWGDSPVAKTKHGRVRGATNEGILVFKGVRYGADTGPTRFMAPQAPAAWRKTIDALQYGAASPQTSGSESSS